MPKQPEQDEIQPNVTVVTGRDKETAPPAPRARADSPDSQTPELPKGQRIALIYKKRKDTYPTGLPDSWWPLRDMTVAEVRESLHTQGELDGVLASGVWEATDDVPHLPKEHKTDRAG